MCIPFLIGVVKIVLTDDIVTRLANVRIVGDAPKGLQSLKKP